MQNKFTEQIQNHRSLRKFKPIPIQKEILQDVLISGIRSSTSSNMQFYSIIKTTEEKLKQKLYTAHSEQEMVLKAPVVFTFCCDQRRIKNWMKQSETHYEGENFLGFMRGVIDVCLVAQNMAVAAESHDLGICYMGSTLTSAKQISQILNLPEYVFPVTSMVMGYPEVVTDKVDRLPLEAVLHQETYTSLEDKELLEIYHERESSTFKRFKQTPRLAKVIEEKDLKNISQVYTSTKFTPQFLQEKANELFQHYRDQGFK